MVLLVQLGMVDSFCLRVRPCGTGSGLHALRARGQEKRRGDRQKKKDDCGDAEGFSWPKRSARAWYPGKKSRRGTNEGGEAETAFARQRRDGAGLVYLYLPRLKDRDVLAQAIRSGAASRDF